MGPSGAGKTQRTLALCGASSLRVSGSVRREGRGKGTFVATARPLPLDLTADELLGLYGALTGTSALEWRESAAALGLVRRDVLLRNASTGERKRTLRGAPAAQRNR